MATQPAKSSPSNQQMHRGEDNTAAAPMSKPKEPPSWLTISIDSPPQTPAKEDEVQKQAQDEQKQVNITTTVTPSTLTYFSSATSNNYVSAKQLLKAGNFEDALALIEQASEKTKMAIRTRLALTINDNEQLERAIELHESIAPFFYLYGTTLLYSLEEAKEDENDNSAMTVASVATAGVQEQEATIDTAAASVTIENEKQPSTSSSSNQGAATTTTIAANTITQQQQTNNNDEDFAEDIQIAWENLDTARNIIEKMIGEGNPLSETDAVKLQLDLAQIHLREGDLERINGNYSPAIEDYSSCLHILLRHTNTTDENDNVRNLDRKIADTQFNLGLTYLTSSSDLQKELTSDGDGNNNTSTPNNNNAAIMTKEHCEKGIQQYVECATTFCRILATLVGVEPETILSKVSKVGDSENVTANATAPAGFKTTGLNDDDVKPASTTAAVASQTLNILRNAVVSMILSHSPSDSKSMEYVYDIQQVLDEIQETIDEAERSQEGVRQAAQIRVNAQKQVSALSDASGGAFASVTDEDTGVITSIGFGPGSLSVSTDNKIDTTTAAKPMMVVKKKKKRKDISDGEISKSASTTDVKRAKTDK
mmetsp:Transcript_6618/g.7696  ORF Transcript_6618/g.7696 Transcript_6618/m.7696 type:complete len:596 (-) Transcript_6618:221-2008(-)